MTTCQTTSKCRKTTLSMCVLCMVFIGFAQASAATYYVDANSGSDHNDGTSQHRAWQSLERINATTFQPGDRILLRRGTRYTGQLKPRGSGNRQTAVRVDTYGTGRRPRIDGEGKHLDAVLLHNVEYWEIRGLEVTNHGPERKPWRTGVHILADGDQTYRHIVLDDIYVHDVNGDLRKSHEGCGIFFECRGKGTARFDDLRIENCHLVRTDRNGICQRTSNRSRSTRVMICGNVLEDIGGDGIKPWGSNGAVVQRNVLRGGRMRCADAAAGIWPWDCDDTLIQFNEVSGMRGIKDGQAFDSDFRCRRSVFQYNYSHDNDGGFFLICAPGTSYCEDTVIRYNISQNDGINTARVFHFGGGASNTRVHNNVVYIGPHQDLPMLLFTEWNGGVARNTSFYNNIFYVDGRVGYDFGDSTNNVFSNNVFHGKHVNRPSDPHAIVARPPLVAPGSGGDGFRSLDGYWLSVPRGMRGRLVTSNGGRDFFGNPVAGSRPATIGAFEFPQPWAVEQAGRLEAALGPDFQFIGSIRPRHARDIKASNWSIGAETMDRDFTVYANWRCYLGPLGAKKARIQSGWAKTEKRRGEYDWQWLDEIIPDMVAQGVEPWVCLCYGNPIYPGGGGTGLGGGLVSSAEALRAWQRYVAALVRRYGTYVDEWELWNEPRTGRGKGAVQYAQFVVRTAATIRAIQPNAEIMFAAGGAFDVTFAQQVLEFLKSEGKLELVNTIIYHPYSYNPSDRYAVVEKLRQLAHSYSPHIGIRQGENGAPSQPGSFGAIAKYDWTEVKQAKWALRRLLGDLGRDIPSSYFAICDMRYPDRINYKGLLAINPDKTVHDRKIGYFAVQNLTAMFDHTVQRDGRAECRVNAGEAAPAYSVFGYQTGTEHTLVTLWRSSDPPGTNTRFDHVDLTIRNGRFDQPVWVDLLSGRGFAVAGKCWTKTGRDVTFQQLPVYDSACVIIDRSDFEPLCDWWKMPDAT